jgi:hypothetical protein
MEQNPLDPFSLGIGRLCHAWAEMEKAVAFLFGELIGAKGPVHWGMIDCLNPRDIMQAVRVGAVGKASNDADHLWADTTVNALDYIDNVLRSLRNRYVHDPWWVDPTKGVIRANTSPRLLKGQAFQNRKVEFVRLSHGLEEELHLLIGDVKAFDGWLWRLADWLERWRTDPRAEALLEALLAEQPPQRLPLGTPQKLQKARRIRKEP